MPDITAAQHQGLNAPLNFMPVKTELAPPIQRQAVDWSGIGRAAWSMADAIGKSPLNPAVKAQMLYQAQLYGQATKDLQKNQANRQFYTGYGPAGPTITAPAQAGPAAVTTQSDANPVSNANANANPDSSVYSGGLNSVANQNPTAVGMSDPYQGLVNSNTTLSYAEGGVAGLNGPEIAMVGEKGPEAIIPLNRNQPPPAPGVTQGQYMTPSPQMMMPPGPPVPTSTPGGSPPIQSPAASTTPSPQTIARSSPSVPTTPSPQDVANWQEQNAHPPGGTNDVLQFVKNNFTTRAQDATYMPSGGPAGSPAYAIHMKGGTTNIIPLQQLVKNGFAPTVASSNTSAVLSQANQPPGQPGGGPPGTPPPTTPSPGMIPGQGQPPMTPSPGMIPGAGAPPPPMTPSPGMMPPGPGAAPSPTTPSPGMMPGPGAGPPPAPGNFAPNPAFTSAVNAATNVPAAGGPPTSGMIASTNGAGQPPPFDPNNPSNVNQSLQNYGNQYAVNHDNPSNAPAANSSVMENPIPAGEKMGQPNAAVNQAFEQAKKAGLNNMPDGPDGTKLVYTAPNGYKWFADNDNSASNVPFLVYKDTPWGQIRMPNDGRWTTYQAMVPDGTAIQRIAERGGIDSSKWSPAERTNWLLNDYWTQNGKPEAQDTRDKLSSIQNQVLQAQRMNDDLQWLKSPKDLSWLGRYQEALAESKDQSSGTPVDWARQAWTKVVTGNKSQINPAMLDFMTSYNSLMAGLQDPGLVPSERAQIAAIDLNRPNALKYTISNFLNSRSAQYSRYVTNAIANREFIGRDFVQNAASLRTSGRIVDPGHDTNFGPAGLIRTQSVDNQNAVARQNAGATGYQGPPGEYGSDANPIRIRWNDPAHAKQDYDAIPYGKAYYDAQGRPFRKLPPNPNATPATMR